MDFRDLKFFVTVAEDLHFARAAKRLHIVPAAVSQRIRDLEAELGVLLFERTSRRVRLTAAGAALLGPAKGALAGLDAVGELAHSLAAGNAGRFGMAISPNSGLFAATAIGAINQAHPGVEIVGRSMWSRDAVAAVEAGEVEAAVVRGPVAGSGLGSVVLGTYDDGYVAVPAGDALAAREELSLADLDGRPMLVVERELAPAIHDATVEFFAAHDAVPQWRTHRMQDYAQQMVLVAAALGSTLIHSHQAAVAYEGIEVIPLLEPAPGYELELVWRAAGDSPLLRTLRALAKSGSLSPDPRGETDATRTEHH